MANRTSAKQVKVMQGALSHKGIFLSMQVFALSHGMKNILPRKTEKDLSLDEYRAEALKFIVDNPVAVKAVKEVVSKNVKPMAVKHSKPVKVTGKVLALARALDNK